MALFCDSALLADGWHGGVRIEIGPQGTITALTSGPQHSRATSGRKAPCCRP